MFLQLLVYGIIAGAANVAGGLILLPEALHRKYKGLLRYLLALGAGFMLAVTLIEILPKTVALWQVTNSGTGDSFASPLVLMLTGYLLTQFLEHTLAPHFHLGEEMHCDEHDHPVLSTGTAYTALGGMLVHTFFDGISIAAATQIDAKIGLLVFLAIFLHKFPEGFTIGSMVMAAGRGRREVLISTSLIGLATIVGVLSFYIIGSLVSSAVAYALPIAGGVTLYVAASDLIPEVNHHGNRSAWVSLSVFAGVALFFGIHTALHSVLE